MRLLGNGPTRTPTQALDAIDAALAIASRSRLVAADEAVGLLRGVHTAVEGGAPAVTIASIITEAEISYSGQAMLDRSQLVNPLLDIRLAIDASASGFRVTGAADDRRSSR
jgi:hypothetical protein